VLGLTFFAVVVHNYAALVSGVWLASNRNPGNRRAWIGVGAVGMLGLSGWARMWTGNSFPSVAVGDQKRRPRWDCQGHRWTWCSDAPGGRPAWTALGRTVDLRRSWRGATEEVSGGRGNMGFQVRAAISAARRQRRRARPHWAPGGHAGGAAKSNLEFIKAQKVDVCVQGAQKQASSDEARNAF